MDHSKYNPDRLARRSIRLPDRDYSSASAYFVTIHADRHEPLFEAPELRTILIENWKALPTRFPMVELDEFVIMPDHIHCILWIKNKQKDTPTLGRVIGAYKSLPAVAWLRHIQSTHMECSGRIWQSNYYERVIRVSELEKTRAYIRNNPTQQNDTH